ncbi:DNA mismatch repair protein Mlh3-like [Patiria miniata]|uniref:DNA mismatch repair protein Mlh3 n=1 Tax=Patiria miniata TaxID=46514 RepID=A0A914BI99_PATMI|nr:DNA mismatch repair protein Mlh3-like [Patiria miniata]
MIHLLPPEVRACLRSGVAAPSIAQCVEELVLNGVDAEATCIAVRVDIPNCRIQVVDNGRGLTRDDFELVGHRYATSKCSQLADLDNLDSFGYRGEALASISHISRVLEIVSRAEGSDVTLTKLFKDGKSEVFEISRKRPSVGTTVTAHSVFYNLPVRRRMVSDSLDYERVCQRLEGLALIHPHVSFSLRNDSTGAKSIQTFKTSSVLNTFRFLFGDPKARCLKEVTYQHGKFTVCGYMGVEGHPNKDLQFVYVNSRLVLRTKLHKALNHLLRKSLIAHCRPMSESAEKPLTDVTDSPCNATDQYGIFVLNIKCPRSEYDVCLEPSKSLVEFKDWHGILNCIEQLVHQFLTRENLTMRIDKQRDRNSPGDKCDAVLGDDSSSQDQDADSDTCEASEWGVRGSLSHKYGKGISASSCSNTLKSLTVRRTQCKLTCETVSTNIPSKDSSSCDGCENVETLVSEVEEKSTKLEMPYKISTEADVAKDKLPSQVKEMSACDSGVVEHSEINEPSGSGEMTGFARQHPILPSSTMTNTCFKHLESSTRLDGLLSENSAEAKQPISISDNFCVAVPSELNVEPVKLASESEETGHVSDSQHSSESKDNSSMDQAVLCIGYDIRDPASQLSTADLSKASCKTGRTCLQLGKVHDAPSDKTFLISHLGGNEMVHPASELNKKNTPPQNKIRRVGESNSQENCLNWSSPLSNSSTPSIDQEQDDNEECDSQFITPKTKKPNKLAGGNGRFMRQHGTSPTSSSDASGLDSESETCVSNSSLLFGKDEIGLSSESASSVSVDGGRKESQLYLEKACHKIAEVEPAQHFIALKPAVANGEQSDNTGTSSSMYSKYLGRPTSSFQTFKKSIQVKAFSSRSSGHRVSDLLRDEEEMDNCEFDPKSVGSQNQSARFTTASPILLKRRFTQGLLMREKDVADTTAAIHTCRVTDLGVALKRNSNLDIGENSETAPLACCTKKPKCDSHTRCAPDKFESPVVVESKGAVHLIPKDQACIATSESTHEEKERKGTKHINIPLRPNLKRLKQISVPATSAQSVAELPKGIMNNTDQEGRICEQQKTQEPPIKRFMTSDGFMLHADASTNKPVSERKVSTDVELFLQVVPRCLRDPPVWKEGDKQLAEPADADTRDSSQIKSKTNSQVGNIQSCTSADIDEKSHASPMQVQETASSQEKLVFERSDDHQEVQQSEDGWRSLHEEKNVFFPLQLFPSCAQTHSGSALENISDCNSCQEIPLNSQDTSSESLLMPAGWLDSDNLEVAEEDFLNPRHSLARCVIPQKESAISEFTETGSYQCPIDDNVEWLMTYADKAAPEYLQSDDDTSTPATILRKNLSNPCDFEANSTCCIHGSVQVLNYHDKNSVSANECSEVYDTELVETQQRSTQTPSDGKNMNLNDPNQNEEPSDKDNATSCPAVFTDTFGKMWTSHFNAKLRTEVYVDLTTGNCRLEMPHTERLGSSEDGMSQEDGTDADNHPSALIIPTGRKRSHLHRSHSLCAQPFLSVSAGMYGVPSRPATYHNLSPSSHSALIDMVDDHIDQQGDEIASKWRGDDLSKQTVGDSSTDQLLVNWTNPMFPSLEADILDAKSSHMLRNCIRTQNTVNPCKFTKAMFQRIKVLGQVDNKFIACMVSSDENNKASEANLLLMIDQHAAHERVRLEQLVSDVTYVPTTDDEDCGSDTAEQSQVKSSSVVPPVALHLTDKELRLLQSFSDKLERLGVSYRIVDNDDESHETGGRVEITRLPSCLVEREVAELSRSRQPVAVSLVQALLEEHLHELQRTAGASAVLPKTLTRILNSQACHGAIKFGDPLSHRQCLSLIGQLSQCQLPFQCAHGRPSVIPLFDLKLLASTVYDKVDEHKPRLWHLHGKLEKMKKGS